jgi:hypothetical protein
VQIPHERLLDPSPPMMPIEKKTKHHCRLARRSFLAAPLLYGPLKAPVTGMVRVQSLGNIGRGDPRAQLGHGTARTSRQTRREKTAPPTNSRDSNVGQTSAWRALASAASPAPVQDLLSFVAMLEPERAKPWRRSRRTNSTRRSLPPQQRPPRNRSTQIRHPVHRRTPRWAKI